MLFSGMTIGQSLSSHRSKCVHTIAAPQDDLDVKEIMAVLPRRVAQDLQALLLQISPGAGSIVHVCNIAVLYYHQLGCICHAMAPMGAPCLFGNQL